MFWRRSRRNRLTRASWRPKQLAQHTNSKQEIWSQSSITCIFSELQFTSPSSDLTQFMISEAATVGTEIFQLTAQYGSETTSMVFAFVTVPAVSPFSAVFTFVPVPVVSPLYLVFAFVTALAASLCYAYYTYVVRVTNKPRTNVI